MQGAPSRVQTMGKKGQLAKTSISKPQGTSKKLLILTLCALGCEAILADACRARDARAVLGDLRAGFLVHNCRFHQFLAALRAKDALRTLGRGHGSAATQR